MSGRSLGRLAVVAAVWASMGAPCSAETWRVGGGAAARTTFAPGTAVATLAEALERAADGDVIELHEGVHDGRFRFRRSVTVRGVGDATLPVIRGVVQVLADDVAIDRCVFEGARGAALTAFQTERLHLTRCTVRNSTSGFALRGCRLGRVERCRFLDVRNAVTMQGGGEHLVRGNVVDGGSWRVINLEASCDNRIEENVLVDVGWTGFVAVEASTGNHFVGNTVHGGQVGLQLQSNDNVVEGNDFHGCCRGVYIGRGPYGQRADRREQGAFVDAEDGDERVVVSGCRVVENRFRGMRREAVLLKEAADNELWGNHVVDAGTSGFTLMHGCLRNVFRDNRVDVVCEGQRIGPVALDVDGQDNEFLGFRCGVMTQPPRSIASGSARSSSPCLAPSSPEWEILFGDLHVHSLLSDGGARPDEVFEYARDVVGLDFCALSDHGEWLAKYEGRWASLLETVARHNRVDGFRAIAGTEVTFLQERWGHYNVYFPQPDPSLPLFGAPHGRRDDLPDLSILSPHHLVDAVKEGAPEALVVRHHYHDAPGYWLDAPRDASIVPLAEIASVHGIWSGFRADDEQATARSRDRESHVSTVAGGMEAGVPFGVVAGSDSHFGFAGDRGLQAVLVPVGSRETLFDACRARRTYGTTGARIALFVSLAGEAMGGVVDTVGEHELDISVRGTAALREVRVAVGETEVVRWAGDGTRSLERRQPLTCAPGDAVWVLVEQADGERAWSSPVVVAPRAAPATDPARLREKWAESVLLHAAALRAWPLIPRPTLGGLTPLAAAVAQPRPDGFDALIDRYETTARALLELGDTLGLGDEGQRAELLRTVRLRWPELPTQVARQLEAMDGPLVDVEGTLSLLRGERSP